MSAEGALRFARYAYPPNALGYCGPEGADAMLADGAVTEIERRARLFEGAWVYLELLAEAMGVDDPLADAVVETYWVGGDALAALDPAAVLARLETVFATQLGGSWRGAADRARAHHSFQVFEVYPWAGMLLRGLAPAPAVSVLDRCRIRSGVVTTVDGEHVGVTSSLLAWSEVRLGPGEPTPERARWSLDGSTLIEPPQVGDLVSLHWDWVCEVITPEQAAMIERLEHEQRVAIGLSS
ncbi:MAG: DUF6390 family protein [Nocardioides sp.]